MISAKEYILQTNEIVELLRMIGLSYQDMAVWMETQFEQFDNRSPRDLVKAGEGSEVISTLHCILSGNVSV